MIASFSSLFPKSLPGAWGAFASAVANHLWQSTLFAAIVAVLALTLRNNRAHVRYWLWFTASAKLLFPFSLLILLGTNMASLHPIAKPTVVTNANAYFVMQEASQPFDLATLPSLPPAPAPSPIARLRAALGGSFLPPALAAIWLAGFLFILGRWWLRWYKIARIVRIAPALTDGREADTLLCMQHAAGLKRSITLKSLPIAIEPGIFGIFRPVLLWPEGISSHLDDQQLAAIIAHEVCHVRRGDNLTAALHMAVEAIFWFHPLVWWLETRLIAERETACDQDVPALCGPASIYARAYAESILKVCEFSIESPLPCIAGVTGADLRRRIAAIVTGRALARMSWPKKVLLAAAMLCAIAAPVMLGLTENPLHALLAEGQALTREWEAAAGGRQEFDVAAVRPSGSPGNGGANFMLGPGNAYAKTGGRFSAHNLALVDYIRFAYKLTDSQTQLMEQSAPGWIKTDQFDIEARSENHDPSKDQMRLMVRSLLADRFALKVHTETRYVPVLAMVLNHPGRLGPQLRPHPANGPPCSSIQQPLAANTAPQSDTVSGGFPLLCGGLTDAGHASAPGHIRIGARDVPLRLLASNIGGFDRPLLDRTGLSGTYDLVLEWGADPAMEPQANAASGDSGTTLEEALREQLGIKLVRQNGPIDVLVIDHIEKPTTQNAEAQSPATPQAAAPADGAADMSLGPAFEVATIRPGNRDDGRRWFGIRVDDSGHFETSAATLNSLIVYAYVGSIFKGGVALDPQAPKWANTDEFDINAKVDDAYMTGWDKMTGQQRADLVRPMVRRLLIDRFKLKLRPEMRDRPVYALVQAKGGSKLKEVAAPPPPEGNEMEQMQKQMAAMRKDPAAVLPGQVTCPILNEVRTCIGKAVPMSQWPGFLMGFGGLKMDRMVIDETGLKGFYDFSFTLSTDADVASPMEQIQEQTGLRFEPRSIPVTTYVILSAEKPSVDGAEVAPAASVVPAAMLQEKAADSSQPSIKWDVVSVKPNHMGINHPGSMLRPDGFDAENISLIWVMYYAYGFGSDRNPHHFSGLPDWVGTERFDIIGKVAAADIDTWRHFSEGQKEQMVRVLIEDRFKMRIHAEAHDAPIYALVLAKENPGLVEVPQPTKSGDSFMEPHAPGWEVGHAVTMKTVVAYLSNIGLERPVQDRTGLSGYYNFSLKFSPTQVAASTNGEATTPEQDARTHLSSQLSKSNSDSSWYRQRHRSKNSSSTTSSARRKIRSRAPLRRSSFMSNAPSIFNARHSGLRPLLSRISVSFIPENRCHRCESALSLCFCFEPAMAFSAPVALASSAAA